MLDRYRSFALILALCGVARIAASQSQLPPPPVVPQSEQECIDYGRACWNEVQQRAAVQQQCTSNYFSRDHATAYNDASRRIRTVNFPTCPGPANASYVPPQCDGPGEAYCSARIACYATIQECRVKVAQSVREGKTRQADDLRVVNAFGKTYGDQAPSAVADAFAGSLDKSNPALRLYRSAQQIDRARNILTALSASSSQEDRSTALANLGLEAFAPAFRGNGLSSFLTGAAMQTLLRFQFQGMADIERQFAKFDAALTQPLAFTQARDYLADYKSANAQSREYEALTADIRSLAEPFYGDAVSASRFTTDARARANQQAREARRIERQYEAELEAEAQEREEREERRPPERSVLGSVAAEIFKQEAERSRNRAAGRSSSGSQGGSTAPQCGADQCFGEDGRCHDKPRDAVCAVR